MKNLVCILFSLMPITVLGQVLITPDSQGMGTGSPRERAFEVRTKGLNVHSDYEISAQGPSNNVVLLTNNASISNKEAAGILKDPNGDSDYLFNTTYNCKVNLWGANVTGQLIGYELTFNVLDTEADGDSVIIRNFSSDQNSRNSVYYKFSGNTLPEKLLIFDNDFDILFVADGDGNVGAGFEIEYRAITTSNVVDEEIGNPVLGLNNLTFNPKNGAFFAGRLPEVTSVGPYSASLGSSTATGSHSLSAGNKTSAIGYCSVALGLASKAEARGSVALGEGSVAEGLSSVAIGEDNIVRQRYGSTIGLGNDVRGEGGVALGGRLISKASTCVVLGYANDTTDSPSVLFGDRLSSDRVFQIGNGTRSSRSNAMTVLRNGYIGTMNTLNPQANLHLSYAGSSNWDAHLRLESPNNEHVNIVYDNDGLKFRTWGTTDDYYFRNSANTTLVRINDTGSMSVLGTVTANGVTLSSDRRLKKDIVGLSNSSDKLTQLNGYHYHWKATDRDTRLQTGLIAQEVQALFPELVSEDENGFLSVNYTGLIPHLIEAVKDLQQENDELKVMNSTYGNRLTNIEETLNQLVNNNTSAQTIED